MTNLNLEQILTDFPTLSQPVYDKKLIYLDNAASTLKPKPVIDRITRYYSFEASNVHRGAHFLSDRGTQSFEGVRQKVQKFLNARESAEVIFTRGTTEGINLVAASYGRRFLKAGDEIILSEMEHHSNIVPWQMVAEEKGCVIRVVPVRDNGELDLDAFRSYLNDKTKFVSILWASNALGTVNPIEQIISLAHDAGAKVLVDAAQAASSLEMDVQKLNCDFLVFSGHKMFAPYGVGVLYGRREILGEMPPYQGGGSMISEVHFDKSTYLPAPHRFEAGTPDIGGVVGLGAAIDYIQGLGLAAIRRHEQDVLNYATEQLHLLKGLRFIGEAEHKVSIISFLTEQGHPADVGSLLDRQGIAVRTGHHCCQPLMRRFGITGTVRASFSIYNTRSEVDVFVQAIDRLKEFF